jgi:dTDP-4-dehydrorhamnose reductase
VCDQIGAPTWSREIAKATVEALALLRTGSKEDKLTSAVKGTYHLTAAGQTSWHGFATAIFEEASANPQDLSWLAKATGGNPFIFRRVVPVKTNEFPTPARRPAYSVLSNARLLHTFGIQLPDWRLQLHSAFIDS